MKQFILTYQCLESGIIETTIVRDVSADSAVSRFNHNRWMRVAISAKPL